MHLLVIFSPTMAHLSPGQQPQRGVLARLRQAFPDVRRYCKQAKRMWSESYSAESVGGAPMYVMRQYIEQQDRREWPAHARPPSPPA